jgi:hypothetical protein
MQITVTQRRVAKGHHSITTRLLQQFCRSTYSVDWDLHSLQNSDRISILPVLFLLAGDDDVAIRMRACRIINTAKLRHIGEHLATRR